MLEFEIRFPCSPLGKDARTLITNEVHAVKGAHTRQLSRPLSLQLAIARLVDHRLSKTVHLTVVRNEFD